MNKYAKSEVPSKYKELLGAYVGRRIVSAIRYSWLPPSEAATEFKINKCDVFSLTAGAIVIALDSGEFLGIAYQPSAASVIVWLEKNAQGEFADDEPAETDPELFPISAQDPIFSDQFWQGIVGQKVEKITIYRRLPQNAKYEDLPNEAGLCFTLESGTKFCASHNLYSGPDDFLVIDDRLIADSMRLELTELDV